VVWVGAGWDTGLCVFYVLFANTTVRVQGAASQRPFRPITQLQQRKACSPF